MPVLSKKLFEKAGCPEGTITRCAANFQWPEGGGLMMMDYDPPESQGALSQDTLRESLFGVVPGMSEAGLVQWYSASSYIALPDGAPYTGAKGQRVWVLVEDANDIPRAGQVLFDRLWLAGHGRIEISKSGSLLERSLVDASVWQPERLDFVAGAYCRDGIRQNRPAPLVLEGGPLNTRQALPDLTSSELKQLESIKGALRQSLELDRRTQKKVWGVGKSETQAVDGDALLAHHVLILDNGRGVTIREVLAEPEKFDGMQTKDPHEPDYQGGKTCGKLFLSDGPATLHSFAHGGRSFRLIGQAAEVEILPGQMAEAVSSTLKILTEKNFGLYLNPAGELCTIDFSSGAGAKARVVTESYLQNFLSKNIYFFRSAKKKRERIDPPAPFLRQILAVAHESDLPRLEGINNAPVLLPDGRVRERPGYDPDTRLFLDFDGEAWPKMPEHVGRLSGAEVQAAYERIMRPFRGFPFCGERDKAVLLAGMISGAMLPALDTKPAFAFDAPCPASGKTLLASCLGVFIEGDIAGLIPGSAPDDEMGKRVFALLLEGRRCIAFDNIEGGFGSPTLNSVFTAPCITDRILGASRTRTVKNKSLFCLTGNNIRLKGDMAVRRVMVCRIDPKTERPAERDFDFDPVKEIKIQRMSILCDVFSLVKDHILKNGKTLTPKKFSAYPMWDALVRQVVFGVTGIDVLGAFYTSASQAPDKNAWEEVLERIADYQAKECGGKPFVCRNLWEGIGSDRAFMEAFEEAMGKPVQNARSLGNLFSARKDRVMGGLVLKEVGRDRSKTVLWGVCRTDKRTIPEVLPEVTEIEGLAIAFT
ncbi:hypothetical protein [Desulfobotulus alkaliphilus]|nr:hypothetical protein [Desulfobotulus alkaliphilus]